MDRTVEPPDAGQRLLRVRVEPVESPPAARTIGKVEAFIHLWKGNLGPGLLALPRAYASVGVAPWALICLAFVTAQGVGSMWLLTIVQQHARSCIPAGGLPTSGRLTFEDLGTLAYGRGGRASIQLCIFSLQFGVCTVYISLVADSLQLIAAGVLTQQQAAVLAAAPCLLLALLPDLSHLWLLSAIGTLAMLFALSSTVVAAVSELALANSTALAVDVALTDAVGGQDSPLLLRLGGTLATSVYALEGMAIVLPVGNAMSEGDAQRYPLLVVVAMGSLSAVFGIVACTTALGFPHVSSASITAYLMEYYAQTAYRSFFYAVNLLIAAVVVLTFPLQLTPISLLVDQLLGLRSRRTRLLARVVLVGSCLLLVLSLQGSLTKLIDLTGAVANTSLCALPPLLHLRLFFRQPGFRNPAAAIAASGRRDAPAGDERVLLLGRHQRPACTAGEAAVLVADVLMLAASLLIMVGGVWAAVADE